MILAPDEDAFWIFVSLMDTQLRTWFSKNSIQMEVDASLFNKVVEMSDAHVAKKLYTDLGIPQTAVCRPWCVFCFVLSLHFLTIYTGSSRFSHGRYPSNTSIEYGTSSYTKVLLFLWTIVLVLVDSFAIRCSLFIPRWHGHHPLLSSLAPSVH